MQSPGRLRCGGADQTPRRAIIQENVDGFEIVFFHCSTKRKNSEAFFFFGLGGLMKHFQKGKEPQLNHYLHLALKRRGIQTAKHRGWMDARLIWLI